MRIAEFKFDRHRDIAWSAERARLLGSLSGLSQKRRINFGKAVREIVAHAIGQGKTGTIQFGLQIQGDQQVEATVRWEQDDENTKSGGQIDRGSIRTLTCEQEIVTSQRHIEIRLAEPLPEGIPRIPPEIASDWATTLGGPQPQRCVVAQSTQNRRTCRKSQVCRTTGVDLQSELDSLRSLNQTLELLALVASKTDNAVIILDSEHCVEWVNDSFVRMTGYEMTRCDPYHL